MKLSARNILSGRISAITSGAVNTLVGVALEGGTSVWATITNESAESLGLKPGLPVFAIVKASSIIVGRDLHQAALSARNLLCGKVCKIVDGPVSAEVDLEVAPGTVLTAVITHESARSLEFRVGDHACAVFKASSVILGLP